MFGTNRTGSKFKRGRLWQVYAEFTALQSDAERVEYLLASSPTIRDFELKTKLGTKNLEQSIKLREEGNRFFQAEQTMQVGSHLKLAGFSTLFLGLVQLCWPLSMQCPLSTADALVICKKW